MKNSPMYDQGRAQVASGAGGDDDRAAHEIRCLLLRQCSIPLPPDQRDVDELVAALDRLHDDAAIRAAMGAAARHFMADWSWRARVGQLMDAIGA